MKIHWTEWAILTALVGAACVAIYAGLTRAMRRAVAEQQRETDRQLNAMATTVKALQARVAELGGQEAAPAEQAESTATSDVAENEAGQKQESPQPEVVAVLTAAATTFLGKKARIRSAQLAPAEQSSAGAWAQQGRVSVQTSHNLRPRG